MARATYNFILETSGRDILDDDVFDALSEAGCDDAGIGRFLGVDHLDFDREAGSFCKAVRSAIEDVQSVPGVNVTRVVPGDDPAVGAAFTEAANAGRRWLPRCGHCAGERQRDRHGRGGFSR